MTAHNSKSENKKMAALDEGAPMTGKTATDGPRCHCGQLGLFGYEDRAVWPRPRPDGSANVTSGARLVWFCAAHRFGQCYAHAVGGGER